MAINNGLKITQLDVATGFDDKDFFAVARGNKTLKLAASNITSKIESFTNRFQAQVPTGSKSVNIVHNLNTLNVVVSLYENSTNQQVFTTITTISSNTIRLTFKTLPTTNQYRVLVTR